MTYCELPRMLQPFYCEELIRLGKAYDGGYLVNKLDVLKTKKILSFGIGSDSSFEQDFLQLKSCPLDAYDDTDSALELFKEDCRFFPEAITPKNIDSILEAEQGPVFLKCDIEGAEYAILDVLISKSRILSGVAIELHDVHNNFTEVADFIAKLGMPLIHVHVNNYTYLKGEGFNIPTVLELTFTSSNNIALDRDITLPHVLDMPNNPKEPQFSIGFR